MAVMPFHLISIFVVTSLMLCGNVSYVGKLPFCIIISKSENLYNIFAKSWGFYFFWGGGILNHK